MKTAWTEDAWQEYLAWQNEDQKILAAINDLIKDIKSYTARAAASAMIAASS
jgi:Txe/YoeB family toxin of Txe-Axe toxin-antitoxin module